MLVKGQLISKANCQAEDSPKKRTNEFVFTTVLQPASMRTLCSWAKILRNITSRLARQRTTHAAPAACVEKPHH